MEVVGLHVLTLLVTAVVIIYSDHQGYLYFRGKKQLLGEKFLQWSHRLVWAGLCGMIVTGVFLTIPSWTYRLQEPIFYVKMGFVMVLIVNAIAIGTLARKASTMPFAQLSPIEQKTLLLSGGLSVMGWVGSACIGMFFL